MTTCRIFFILIILKLVQFYQLVNKDSFQVVNSLVADRCLVKTGSPDQLTHLTVRTVFNMNVLSCIQASLVSVHPTLRLLAVELLNSIFQTLQQFLSFVKLLFVNNSKNFVDFKQTLIDHIIKVCLK